MKTVKINRERLLAQLKLNRETHIAEYKEAHELYLAEAVEGLKKMLKDAKAGKVQHHLHLEIPQSYEASYDRAIAMLEWSTDETVELDHSEFESYVRDNWNWKQNFTALAASYKGGI